MADKVIPLNVKREHFSRVYLEVLRPALEEVLSIMSNERVELIDKEILLLSLYIQEFVSYTSINEEERYRLLFDKHTRRKLRDKMGINENNYNVLHSRLKSKKVFIDNKFNPFIKVNFATDMNIIYKINLVKDDEDK